MGAEFELKLAEEQIAILRESVAQLEAENERLRDERDQWKGLYEILATDALLEGKDE